MEDGITPDFSLKWSGGGYDAEWQIFNSKHYGVPHNRERLFIIGHNRNKCAGEVFCFPLGGGVYNQSYETEEKIHDVALCLTAKGQNNWTGSFIVQDLQNENKKGGEHI